MLHTVVLVRLRVVSLRDKITTSGESSNDQSNSPYGSDKNLLLVSRLSNVKRFRWLAIHEPDDQPLDCLVIRPSDNIHNQIV